jgi:hypothetical protein
LGYRGFRPCSSIGETPGWKELYSTDDPKRTKLAWKKHAGVFQREELYHAGEFFARYQGADEHTKEPKENKP